MTVIRNIVFGLLCIALIGCASTQQNGAERRQKLLEMYPPGSTTRADVQNKWGANHCDFSVTRPTEGWRVYNNDYVRARVENSEQRTGKPVYRCERYMGPDGFLSLACCWYYYDEQDRLVDAEWQYHSD
jgi:hypothetical protein